MSFAIARPQVLMLLPIAADELAATQQVSKPFMP